MSSAATPGPRTRSVQFSRIDCSGNELSYVKNVLESGWLTTGRVALEFERKFAEAVGAKFACAVNSCTAALHLALEAAGIHRGDKVLVPSMTFTASAAIIRYLGADTVLCDVDRGSCLMTADLIEPHLAAGKIKAVIYVHFGGQCHGIDKIVELCRRYRVLLVEDAAHAFPARLDGKHAGTFGLAGCFSFYANKTITTGEGGMLVTDDELLYRRAKTMRHHGIDRDAWDRFSSVKADWEYDVVAAGFKYNMPDLNAAVGLAQLERAEQMRESRHRCFLRYRLSLLNVKGIDLPLVIGSLHEHACHLFWIVLRPDAAMARNEFMKRMDAAGIGTSVHYKPLHHFSYYKHNYKFKAEDYPASEAHWQGCVSLPIYASMTDADVDFVCLHVKEILGCI